MKSIEFKWTFIAGVFSASVFWGLFWYIKIRHQYGWVPSEQGVWYNIPISFVFLILSYELFFDCVKKPMRQNLILNWPYLFIWCLGFIQLYFRLIEKSINISGHMTWLTFMIAHSILRKLPIPFIFIIIVVWLHAASFNFILFVSPVSGFYGVLLGSILSLLLFMLTKIDKEGSCP